MSAFLFSVSFCLFLLRCPTLKKLPAECPLKVHRAPYLPSSFFRFPSFALGPDCGVWSVHCGAGGPETDPLAETPRGVQLYTVSLHEMLDAFLTIHEDELQNIIAHTIHNRTDLRMLATTAT